MSLTIPAFQDTLNATIAAIAANTVITQSGAVVAPDFSVGSWNLTFSEVIALALDLLYTQVENAYMGSFVATATGSDLDNLGLLVGVTRNPATTAQATATFTTGSPPITIPTNTVLLISDSTGLPSIQYQTLAPLTLSTTSGAVTAQALVAGSGSTVAGTVTALLQTPVAGVLTATLTPTVPATPGADVETDDAYRARLLATSFINKSTVGNIIANIKNVAGVYAAYVYVAGGVPVDGFGNLGFFVQPQPGTSSFTADQQTAITAAIQSFVAGGITLQPTSNGWATLTPTPVAVAITVQVTDAPSAPAVTAAVLSAITAYLNGLTLGAPVIYNAIIQAVLGVPNVKDQVSLTLSTGSPVSTNIAMAANAVAGAGTITVNWTL